MESILETKKLDLRYGAFQALYGIDTEIFPNEITALIGPSGCGKSTFLKTLNRMNDLVPNVRIEGDVRLRGEDIFSKEMQLTDLRRRRMPRRPPLRNSVRRRSASTTCPKTFATS